MVIVVNVIQKRLSAIKYSNYYTDLITPCLSIFIFLLGVGWGSCSRPVKDVCMGWYLCNPVGPLPTLPSLPKVSIYLKLYRFRGEAMIEEDAPILTSCTGTGNAALSGPSLRLACFTVSGIQRTFSCPALGRPLAYK